MTTAVDTNVLIDILLDDPEHVEASRQALLAAVQAGPAVVCPIVYAELAAHFEHAQDVGAFLRDAGVTVSQFHVDSLGAAAEAWKAYRKKRKDPFAEACPHCGRQTSTRCTHCHRLLPSRRRIISDFLIGAHALIQTDCLLTRDRGYYKM